MTTLRVIRNTQPAGKAWLLVQGYYRTTILCTNRWKTVTVIETFDDRKDALAALAHWTSVQQQPGDLT